MAVRCDRCGRTFQNKYGLWGHRRACRTGAKPAQPASSAYRLAQPGLEPGLSEALVDEEAELRRRRLELERRQLEREEAATWHREIEALSVEIKRQTEITRRREIVNEVCSPFADLPYRLKGYKIPPDTSHVAKRRVHEELERAGAGRSREELLRIAQQAWEQVYAPVLKAQDDARAAAAREKADWEAVRAQEQDEARRREQIAPRALSLDFGNSALDADRVMEDHEVKAGTDDNDEPEDKLEGASEFDDRDGDEADGDIEPEVEPDDEPAATGWGALVRLGAIALGVVALTRLLNPPRVWISDPDTGGDGSFGVGSVTPGPNPPWRVASQAEIQEGLDSGALTQV
jgi:hypothetical protein